ncbi:MAG: hypothetical protein EOP49_05265, partial [Sphingobacteriales bacterium]
MDNSYYGRYLRSILLCICLICLLQLPAAAQRYPFYNLNVENGLIQSQPRDMVQDKYGHLWIATLGGLSRYDGQSFVNYSVRDGLLSNNLNSISIDHQGIIWVGSNSGLSRFDGHKFRHYTISSENPTSNIIGQIRTDARHQLWFLAGNKLYQLVKDQPRPYRLPDTNAFVTSILPDGNQLWAASVGGLIYRLAGSRWDSLRMPPAANGLNHVVYKIFKDRRQRLWFAANTGLYTLDSGRVVLARARNQAMDMLPPLLSMTEDRSGALWLGTNNGVVRLADSIVQFFNKRSGLSDNPFFSMLNDAEGNVWMASDGQGVFRYSGTQFTVVDETTGLPSGQVMSIEADQGGRIFLGTYDAGLFAYEAGIVTPISLPLAAAPAITAMKYRNGSLWLGTRGAGLWKWNGKYFFSYLAENGKLPSNFIASIYKDNRNRLWVGCGNGVVMIDRDTFKRISTGNVSVLDFIQLEGDSILMATSAGLRLYAKGELFKFTTGSALDSAEPQCFTLKGKDLWTGTSDNGVIIYNLETGKSVVINRSNGMQSDFIYNLITDNAGNVWAGTGYGIHRISLNNQGQPSVFFYGKGHGMKGMESNHNAVLKMRDGSIWFGTTNGALHYRPETKLIDPQPTSIIMQSVKLVGDHAIDSNWYKSTDPWYHVPQGLRLPFKKNNISFTFHAISLGNNEQIRYRYRIEGLEVPWSDWSTTNTVTFSALPPGKYKFHVQSMAWGANQQPKELLYPFEIITPFHKTNWFRLLVLAACI